MVSFQSHEDANTAMHLTHMWCATICSRKRGVQTLYSTSAAAQDKKLYDQIYQDKSRNSINPLAKRRREGQKKTEKRSEGPARFTLLFVCRQAEGRRTTPRDTDREQTKDERRHRDEFTLCSHCVTLPAHHISAAHRAAAIVSNRTGLKQSGSFCL